jgi:hypothetical protein
MPSLDELEADRARLQATYQRFVVTFEYHPARVSMNLQRALVGAANPPYDVGPLVVELANVLSAWDVTRRSEPVPVTADGIGSLPLGVSSEIAKSIMEDFGDPKSPLSAAAPSASSTASPPGSKPDDSDGAPTGPTSSSGQNGLASTQPISPGSLTPVGA